MNDPLYRIKPLVWHQDEYGKWWATNTLGAFCVGRGRWPGIWWMYWLDNLCVNERQCETIDQAKADVEAYWREMCDKMMDRVEIATAPTNERN